MKNSLLLILLTTSLIITSCTDNKVQNKKINSKNTFNILKKSKKNISHFLEAQPEISDQLLPSDWEKLQWVSKVLIFLRGGQGLLPDEDIKPYLEKSKEQIVDELISKKEFLESVLLFNVSLIGGHIDNTRSDDRWSKDIFAFQNALNSAIEVSNNGDYFSLFDKMDYFLIDKLDKPQLVYDTEFPPDPENPPRTDDEIFEFLLNSNKNKLKKLSEYVENSPDIIQLNDFCNNQFIFLFLDAMGANLPNRFVEGLGKEVNNICIDFIVEQKSEASKQTIKLATDKKILRTHKLLDLLVLMKDSNSLSEFSKIKKINYSDYDLNFRTTFFPDSFIFELQNSSTNFNRKRSSYILDRFLCDNLVPIDIEIPEEHSDESHGNAPACYACHYRLDPMAGFFKDLGFGFNNFSNEEKIIFDDGATIKREEYDKNWLFKNNPDRKWNIGVIKSESRPNKNYYGESIEDLFKILKTIPEVKQCIVRRMFEFSTHPKQNVDKKFLNKIGLNFIEKSAVNSSDAIKYLFKTMALSKTFNEQDPETSKCYDFAEGSKNINNPPCEVNHILETNCKTCHSSSGAFSGLDLTTWVQVEGKFGFKHIINNKQNDPYDTFERIKQRLQSPDPVKRMPLDKHMDPIDRETLYLWINKKIGGK